jgi:hypothetical protein
MREKRKIQAVRSKMGSKTVPYRPKWAKWAYSGQMKVKATKRMAAARAPQRTLPTRNRCSMWGNTR